MKKIYLIALLALVGLNAVFAQPGRRNFANQTSPEEQVQNRVNQLKEPLMLDDVQAKLLEITLLKYVKQRRNLVTGGQLNREEIRDTLQALNKLQNAEIEKLLIPEQYEIYLQLEKAEREKRPQRN